MSVLSNLLGLITSYSLPQCKVLSYTALMQPLGAINFASFLVPVQLHTVKVVFKLTESDLSHLLTILTLIQIFIF